MATLGQSSSNKRMALIITTSLFLAVGTASWFLGIVHAVPQLVSEIVAMIFAIVGVGLPLWQVLPLQEAKSGTIVVYADWHTHGNSVSLYNGFFTSLAINACSLPVEAAAPLSEKVLDGKRESTAVFHSVSPGNYTVHMCDRARTYYALVTVLSGQIIEIDWR